MKPCTGCGGGNRDEARFCTMCGAPFAAHPYSERSEPVSAKQGTTEEAVIRFQCAACGQTIEAPGDMADLGIDCPTCKAPIVIPSAPPATASGEPPSSPGSPAAPATGPDPATASDSGRRRRFVANIVAATVGVLLCAGGAGALVYRFRFQEGAPPPPQAPQATAADLARAKDEPIQGQQAGADGDLLAVIRTRAESGDPLAQCNLGCRYNSGGQGVEEDHAAAVTWWRKAAEQGNADAQFFLGFSFGNGRGVPKDDGEAVKWCRRAADQGNANGQFYLGFCHGTGKGVARDLKAAYGWALLASAGGLKKATDMLPGLANDLPPEQVEEARSWANNWKPVAERTVTESAPPVVEKKPVVRDTSGAMGYAEAMRLLRPGVAPQPLQDPPPAVRASAREVTVTTWAGKFFTPGNDDGMGLDARFASPRGLAVDRKGNLYVATFNTIRKVTPEGRVTTLAGSPDQNGNADGTGSAARFYNATGVAVDREGNVYVADTFNNSIRMITSKGAVTTIAARNGEGKEVHFYHPMGVAVDADGHVFVADTNNNLIWKITPGGATRRYAGRGGDVPGGEDGAADQASFGGPMGWGPQGIAVDGKGNVYVADTGNSTIRKIAPDRTVTTLAGSTHRPGYDDGAGRAARFNEPRGIAVDKSGTIYVADYRSFTIREVTPEGSVTTLAGAPRQPGETDGPGSIARFYQPEGIAVDAAGTIYVSCNTVIRKITH